MNHRGVPRVIYVVVAHLRFSQVRNVFLRALIHRTGYSVDDVLAALEDARAFYESEQDTNLALIVAMAFEGGPALRVTGPVLLVCCLSTRGLPPTTVVQYSSVVVVCDDAQGAPTT